MPTLTMITSQCTTLRCARPMTQPPKSCPQPRCLVEKPGVRDGILRRRWEDGAYPVLRFVGPQSPGYIASSSKLRAFFAILHSVSTASICRALAGRYRGGGSQPSLSVLLLHKRGGSQSPTTPRPPSLARTATPQQWREERSGGYQLSLDALGKSARTSSSLLRLRDVLCRPGMTTSGTGLRPTAKFASHCGYQSIISYVT
jgi:hypothetical protein